MTAIGSVRRAAHDDRTHQGTRSAGLIGLVARGGLYLALGVPRPRNGLRESAQARTRAATQVGDGSASSSSVSSTASPGRGPYPYMADHRPRQQGESPRERRLLGRSERAVLRLAGQLLVLPFEAQRRHGPDRQDVQRKGDGHVGRPAARRRRGYLRDPRVRALHGCGGPLSTTARTSGPCSMPRRRQTPAIRALGADRQRGAVA